MLRKEEFEQLEESVLADYAMKSRDSKGRAHPEPEHSYRLSFQRDRDRIIHSSAFRRLEYKTQVFVNSEGDYYRTRLTHTLEVAQIARTIARTLRLNEDLVEAIALAHDLGHTPFGHAGEEILYQLMQEHGGFEHNRQGLRVVVYLEEKYPKFKGLNLTWEVREGILKHTGAYDQPQLNEFKKYGLPTLEAQVVDIADEIAYDSHDLDDGITSNLIDMRDLEEVTLWKEAKAQICKEGEHLSVAIQKYQIVKFLINLHAQDIVEQTENKLKRLNIHSVDDVRKQPKKLLIFDSQMTKKRLELREFLNQKLYQHHKVVHMSDKAKHFIRELFKCYIANPQQLPPTSRHNIEMEGVYRVVCDYIAGMTDRYAQNEYRRLFHQ